MKTAPRSIGTRLTLIICLVFSLYLVSASGIGYVMYQQYREFRQLAGEHFDRALKAAELTRNAEVIAAEVFEVLVSGERSLSAGSQRTENLMQLYQATRERLDAGLEENSIMRRDLDRWQQPFFSSLDELDDRLTREQLLQSEHFKRIDRLFLLLQDWPHPVDWLGLPEAEQAFYSQALLAVSHAGAALSAERPGQVAQLRQRVDGALAQLNRLDVPQLALETQRQALTPLLTEMLDAHAAGLRSKRATLAQARQTRVLAQKLTGASYNYHVQLKVVAQEAIVKHQTLIRRSLVGLLLAATGLCAVTALAVFYIRRTVVKRINLLSSAMQAHLDGNAVPIPDQGEDEIAAMGATFAYFVKARQQAEQRLAEANRHLQEVNAELEQLSATDVLTGIANRRCFEQSLAEEWRRAQREQYSLAVIMVDVDRFKAFNDTYGHPEGDECLHRVAQALASCLHRSGDLVARYGGEEFILLLPQLDLEHATRLGEKLCAAVQTLNIPHQSSCEGVVTVSIGVAALTPRAHTFPDLLIGLADNALYDAKASGRNGVRVAASI